MAATLRALLAPSLVLTQNPRTLIQLVVQSLTPGLSTPNPSLTAAFINASTLALLRASSFPMLGVICAVGVARLKEDVVSSKDEKLLLDPVEDDIRQSDAFGCVAIMFRTGADGVQLAEVVWSSFQGAPLQADYDNLLRLAKSGCLSVYEAVRAQFHEDIDRTGETNHVPPKKMPKFKGAKFSQNVGGEDTSMDTT